MPQALIETREHLYNAGNERCLGVQLLVHLTCSFILISLYLQRQTYLELLIPGFYPFKGRL